MIGGRYDIRSHLGSGGMGVVYEVVDRQSDEAIALKMLRRGNGDPQLIRREFRSLAGVTHPNLVQLYDLFDDEGVVYLTMELVRGKDLVSELCGDRSGAHDMTLPDSSGHQVGAAISQGSLPSATTLVNAPPALDIPRIRERFLQLASGLYALHRCGLVHRDIKPQNVRVTDEGRVVILDFGLATMAGLVGSVAGTVAYMAPEQSEGAPVRASGDWYSFGILVHEVLTGSSPWSGSSRDVLRRKQTEAVPLLQGRAGIPEDLAVLVDALVRRNPEERPAGHESSNGSAAGLRGHADRRHAARSSLDSTPRWRGARSSVGASSAISS